MSSHFMFLCHTSSVYQTRFFTFKSCHSCFFVTLHNPTLNALSLHLHVQSLHVSLSHFIIKLSTHYPYTPSCPFSSCFFITLHNPTLNALSLHLHVLSLHVSLSHFIIQLSTHYLYTFMSSHFMFLCYTS